MTKASFTCFWGISEIKNSEIRSKLVVSKLQKYDKVSLLKIVLKKCCHADL